MPPLRRRRLRPLPVAGRKSLVNLGYDTIVAPITAALASFDPCFFIQSIIYYFEINIADALQHVSAVFHNP